MNRKNVSVLAMCSGINCDFRHDCLRHIATPLPDQHWYSFYAEASFTPENGCDHILPVLPDGDPALAQAA